MKFIVAIAVCLAASVAAAAEPPKPPADAAAAEPVSPAVQEALGFLESGNYQACLRKIGIQLSRTNEARPGTTDRYELLMLRGECLLRMRQPAGAASAYDAAAASMKTSRDVARVAKATALAALCKASPSLTYTRKAPGSSPIDIVNAESRLKALQALYDDRAIELTPAIISALAEKSVKPAEALLPRAWELYSLEYATTGDAAKTTANLKELGAHARELLRSELDRLTAQVNSLKDAAGDPSGGAAAGGNAELSRVNDEIVSLQRVAQTGRRIARLLGASGENWDALLADFTDVREAAQQAQQMPATQPAAAR
jgi:hypothetical protein